MKLAMAQMHMEQSMERNLTRTLEFCRAAEGSDLLFFPEIQLSPFFPQYEKRDVTDYCLRMESPEVAELTAQAKKLGCYLSPNVYMELEGKRFDTSLWISPQGAVEGRAMMVHVAQAERFYEQDYYTPSEEGFQVFDTPFGRVGIVICYDRHLPESIRTCALKGAELVIIPTANTAAEPMELFQWEIRVQAMQNAVFIAMCNRVGMEGTMEFAGQSLVAHPSGELVCMADDREQLVTCDIDLREAASWRKKRPYLSGRRPEWYL